MEGQIVDGMEAMIVDEVEDVMSAMVPDTGTVYTSVDEAGVAISDVVPDTERIFTSVDDDISKVVLGLV
jgi:hypothetical protein